MALADCWVIPRDAPDAAICRALETVGTSLTWLPVVDCLGDAGEPNELSAAREETGLTT